MKKTSPNYWMVGSGLFLLLLFFVFFNKAVVAAADCPGCIGMFGLLLLPLAAGGIFLILFGLLVMRK